MKKYTLFISDLHLSENTTKITQLFLQLLNSLTTDIDAIYILGDLFKFWVGDDDHSTYNETIKAALKATSQKLPIYIMPGNRDFLLGNNFAHETGCKLIPDPYPMNLYGQPTLLTHGDILCSKDYKLTLFRALTQLALTKKLFLKLPFSWRYFLAKNIQAHSAIIKQRKSKITLTPQLSTITKLLQKFHATQMIHGHTHQMNEEKFMLANTPMLRLTLGEWTNLRCILYYYADGGYEFRNE